MDDTHPSSKDRISAYASLRTLLERLTNDTVDDNRTCSAPFLDSVSVFESSLVHCLTTLETQLGISLSCTSVRILKCPDLIPYLCSFKSLILFATCP